MIIRNSPDIVEMHRLTTEDQEKNKDKIMELRIKIDAELKEYLKTIKADSNDTNNVPQPTVIPRANKKYYETLKIRCRNLKDSIKENVIVKKQFRSTHKNYSYHPEYKEIREEYAELDKELKEALKVKQQYYEEFFKK